VKATTVSVRLRNYLFGLTNTNRVGGVGVVGEERRVIVEVVEDRVVGEERRVVEVGQ